MVIALAILGASVLLPSLSFAVPVVIDTGSRTTFPGEGLVGTHEWDNGGFVIQWEISFDDDTDLFAYQYTFLDDDSPVLNPALSHWIFEVSPNFTANDISGANFTIEGPGTFDENSSNGNPGIPGSIFGIKADTGTEDVDGVYTFLSTRAPMWGDFYAKDGGGTDPATAVFAYNVGFGTDPAAGTTDFTNWIRVPDTTGGGGQGDAPEPAMVLLLGGALLALYRRRPR